VTPFALPPCDPGGPDPVAVAAAIDSWTRSPELAELVGLFGGRVPDGPLASVLDRVAQFSRVWDFCAGVKERFDTVRVDYQPDLDARMRNLIRALGLGGPPRPAFDRYDHVVVLGGGIRITLGRTEYAARLLAGGLRTRALTGLGSLRWRDDREHREGLRLGLGPIDTEADMMAVGLDRVLRLREPTAVRSGDGWWQRIWSGVHPDVAEVHVLAAVSTRPPQRANTADTLIGWATEVHTPTANERVLLITNDPYVHHQHCDAVRLLGGGNGCGVETVGVDDLAWRTWGRPLSTPELLQEVRSSLLAARHLYGSLVPGS
jgi:hypothetical protein